MYLFSIFPARKKNENRSMLSTINLVPTYGYIVLFVDSRLPHSHAQKKNTLYNH